ncbi:MAG: MlaD family protein [Wenzhouxiangellaceae bacterium]
METRAHFVLIGVFTLLVSLGALLFVLWLGKYSDQEYDYYDVIFEEPVTGLSQGGAVQYNGIQVGEVAELRLDEDNPSRVLARIQVYDGTPVKEDTRAQLGFMGVTGVAFIQLSGGSPSSPDLKPRRGRGVATIIADVSSLQRLIEGGGDVFANVNDLLMRLNRVFADENIAALSASVSHVEQVTASLASERESLEQLLSEGAGAADRLNRVLGRIDQVTGGIENVVEEVDGAVSRHLDELLGHARDSADELRHFSARLREWLEQSEPDIRRFTSDGLSQVTATMEQIGQLSRRLENLARRLEDDPSALFFGGDEPREYEPE